MKERMSLVLTTCCGVRSAIITAEAAKTVKFLRIWRILTHTSTSKVIYVRKLKEIEVIYVKKLKEIEVRKWGSLRRSKWMMWRTIEGLYLIFDLVCWRGKCTAEIGSHIIGWTASCLYHGRVVWTRLNIADSLKVDLICDISGCKHCSERVNCAGWPLFECLEKLGAVSCCCPASDSTEPWSCM